MTEIDACPIMTTAEFAEEFANEADTVEFVPFHAQDAFNMDWIDKNDFLASLKKSPQFFQMLEAEGLTSTVTYKGTVLGVLTTYEYNPCHVYVNMSMSTKIQELFDKEVLLTMKNLFTSLQEQYLRVSVHGKVNNDKLTKLMEYLGFQKDCIMKHFGAQGEDYFLFSLVREKKEEANGRTS